jgi:CubicO group peptidase (beta-lactamase class C family)
MSADPRQPYYVASVGKLFTSTLTSVLYEKGSLSFDDKITEFLNSELLENLHVYKDKDYTDDIEVKHLLNHTSGLSDHFYPLLEEVLKEPDLEITPPEVIKWSKDNLKPKNPPGDKFNYSDTNYHLLGLVIENITGMPFHEALRKYIFEPLDMGQSFMLHYSEPIEERQYPIADFYIRDNRLTDNRGYAAVDYAGGGVVAPGEDLLRFMKSLVNNEIVTEDTLEKMMSDRAKYSIGIDYGYGIMKFKNTPILIPYSLWGNAGATGAFMFYQPETEAYLIGSFNDFEYEKKGVRFMFKIINKLSKCKNEP